MPRSHVRDFVGYGRNPPDPKWPDRARLAINFVINIEEGSEPSVEDGEGFTEASTTEAYGRRQGISGRDLAGEGMFEYGSRVGFWRIFRLFQDRDLPLTAFACALALERNRTDCGGDPGVGFDVCSHGWRWIKHYELPEEEERHHIKRAVEVHREDHRPAPSGLVLPLRTEFEYAPSCRRARRLPLRQRLLRRRAAVLEDREWPVSPRCAVFADQQ